MIMHLTIAFSTEQIFVYFYNNLRTVEGKGKCRLWMVESV